MYIRYYIILRMFCVVFNNLFLIFLSCQFFLNFNANTRRSPFIKTFLVLDWLLLRSRLYRYKFLRRSRLFITIFAQISHLITHYTEHYCTYTMLDDFITQKHLNKWNLDNRSSAANTKSNCRSDRYDIIERIQKRKVIVTIYIETCTRIYSLCNLPDKTILFLYYLIVNNLYLFISHSLRINRSH